MKAKRGIVGDGKVSLIARKAILKQVGELLYLEKKPEFLV